jgi:hypothetical protein
VGLTLIGHDAAKARAGLKHTSETITIFAIDDLGAHVAEQPLV